MFSDAFCLIHVVKLLFHFAYSEYRHYSSRPCSWTGVSLNMMLHSVLSGEEELHVTTIVT